MKGGRGDESSLDGRMARLVEESVPVLLIFFATNELPLLEILSPWRQVQYLGRTGR